MSQQIPKSRTAKALVVDDSAVARKVLSSILHREGLETDVAASAEDALEYLTRMSPDVIFLDHAMPGMDGFDALKLIKENPRTATIPVMMFTSKSGDVYLSQARALGAVDVLNKGTLAEIDLSSRLESLGIFDQPQGVVAQPLSKQTFAMDVVKSSNGGEQRQSATLIRQLIKEEFTRLREDLPDLLLDSTHQNDSVSTDRIESEQKGESPQRKAHRPQQPPVKRQFAWIPLGLAGIFLIAWTLFGLPGGRELELENTQLPVSVKSVVFDKTGAKEEGIPDDKEIQKTLLGIIGWSVNQQMNYGLNELPLDGERLNQVQTLLLKLADADFKGNIELLVHQGQFCTVTDSSGKSQLPVQGSMLSDCQIQLPEKNNSNADLMSLPFAMFLENSSFANGDLGIQVSVSALTDQKPLIKYPNLGEGNSDEWNRVAAVNNRVEIRFY